MKYGNLIRINLNLDEELLKQIKDLAIRDYLTRSELIRQAILEYIRKPGNYIEKTHNNELAQDELDNKDELSQDKLETIRQEFSMVPPNDVELLQFLAYYKDQRSEHESK